MWEPGRIGSGIERAVESEIRKGVGGGWLNHILETIVGQNENFYQMKAILTAAKGTRAYNLKRISKDHDSQEGTMVYFPCFPISVPSLKAGEVKNSN